MKKVLNFKKDEYVPTLSIIPEEFLKYRKNRPTAKEDFVVKIETKEKYCDICGEDGHASKLHERTDKFLTETVKKIFQVDKIIHKVYLYDTKKDGTNVFRYLCNEAVTPTKGKYAVLWKSVTCKNCLRRR